MTRRRYHETTDYVDAVGRMIKAAGRRVGQADPDDLARLVGLQAVLSEAIQAAVDGQRSTGIYWSSIAEATGTTKSAAIQKWGTRQPPLLVDECRGRGTALQCAASWPGKCVPCEDITTESDKGVSN